MKRQPMIKAIVAVLVLMFVVSCGREEESESGIAGTREAVGAAGGAVINALAGVTQKVIGEEKEGLAPTVLAHATPKDVEPFDLTGCKEGSKEIDKLLESPLGFDLIRVKYKITYQWGCQHNGKGSYLANIRFTPITVETDVLYNIKANAVSDAALNIGSPKDPVASVKFAVAFTASGIGSGSVTDEFKLNAKTGELETTIRNW